MVPTDQNPIVVRVGCSRVEHHICRSSNQRCRGDVPRVTVVWVADRTSTLLGPGTASVVPQAPTQPAAGSTAAWCGVVFGSGLRIV